MFASKVWLSLALFTSVASASPLLVLNKRANTTCTPSDPDYCTGANSTGDPSMETYVCGDYRLGPLNLPTTFPVSSLIQTYNRFDDLCPGAFLKKWTFSENSSYHYPPDNGFQLTVNGTPIQGQTRLENGTKLDRFGGETGQFLSSFGAPYVERALPPQNLDTSASAPQYPNGYHVYEVLKPFEVLEGPIAPWFGQPGGGSQFQLLGNTTVATLLSNSSSGPYLRRLNESEY